MAYEMSVDIHDSHIHVVLVGDDDMSAVREYWTRISEILRSNPHRRLLMEEHLRGPMHDSDIHLWSEFMQSLHLPPEMKIAFSYLKERASEYRFAETLLINRGFITKIFPEVQDAKKWLLEGLAAS